MPDGFACPRENVNADVVGICNGVQALLVFRLRAEGVIAPDDRFVIAGFIAVATENSIVALRAQLLHQRFGIFQKSQLISRSVEQIGDIAPADFSGANENKFFFCHSNPPIGFPNLPSSLT